MLGTYVLLMMMMMMMESDSITAEKLFGACNIETKYNGKKNSCARLCATSTSKHTHTHTHTEFIYREKICFFFLNILGSKRKANSRIRIWIRLKKWWWWWWCFVQWRRRITIYYFDIFVWVVCLWNKFCLFCFFVFLFVDQSICGCDLNVDWIDWLIFVRRKHQQQ